ncbi:hypothetical protein SO802_003179 [Lithocarpus litseifolius]|uniref:Uncharacterized protein n=1 Tax=Lithocarpus litseifolius TaxID=425828 RepID=A0AAW2DZE5_9ROSI
MDPLEFMLTPHSMTDAKYNSWGSGIPYPRRLLKGLDYEEFNITRLMPSHTAQKEPAAGEFIDPPHIPSIVYAFGPDGFARERAVPRNPNVIGYPFPLNTRAVTNYLRSLYCPEEVAHPGSGDDDDDGGGGGGDEEDSEVTPSYQPRKRQHH